MENKEVKKMNDEIELLKAKLEARKELCDNLQSKMDKAIEILKDTNIEMSSTLLIETIDYARQILGDKENEN
jgi:hypothetical protein